MFETIAGMFNSNSAMWRYSAVDFSSHKLDSFQLRKAFQKWFFLGIQLKNECFIILSIGYFSLLLPS